MQVTQWFDGNQKPAYKGVYQIHSDDTAFPHMNWYSYWDGKKFRYMTCRGVSKATEFKYSIPHHDQNLRWRGIA